jgi:hypothetical protein
MPAYARQKTLAAKTQRYSPWTGMTAQAPEPPNIFNDVLQGGMTGASFQQNLDHQGAMDELMKARAGYLKRIPMSASLNDDSESDIWKRVMSQTNPKASLMPSLYGGSWGNY